MKKLTKAASLAAGTVLAMGVAAPAFASSGATGLAAHSPGFLSGTLVQDSIDAPLNYCGNTHSFVGLLNPTFGTTCVDAE